MYSAGGGEAGISEQSFGEDVMNASLVFNGNGDHRDRHAFPARRSSDLSEQSLGEDLMNASPASNDRSNGATGVDNAGE